MLVVVDCFRDFNYEYTPIEISKEDLLEKMKSDHSLHEIFHVGDNPSNIRIFVDVDYIAEGRNDPWNAPYIVSSVLGRLNRLFGTTDDDWAIAQCHRQYKTSFHILSKKYCCPISVMQDIYKKIDLIFVDRTLITNAGKYKKLRLPNQSKIVNEKWVAGPLQIVQGDLEDFLISDVTGLTLWPNDAVSRDTNPNSH